MALDPTKPICLNDEDKTPLVLLTSSKPGRHQLVAHDARGYLYTAVIDGSMTGPQFIINAPEPAREPRRIWVNEYRNFWGVVHLTEEGAFDSFDASRGAIRTVEFVEVIKP